MTVFRRKSSKGENGPKTEPGPYESLREMALSSVANGLSSPSEDHPDVSGLVVDIPAQGGFATVVALTDNTTSMYTSVGGGTIGAGEHENVASATQALLSIVQGNLESFSQGDDLGFPPAGQVRFHVLSPSGARHQDVPEDCYWGRSPHELMPVIAASQAVVTAIRSCSG
jgi:hypothetical protein